MTIPGLFNTGVDDSGAPLAAGAADNHYKLIASDDPLFPVPPHPPATPPIGIPSKVTDSPLPGTWTANTGVPSASQWISPNAQQTPQDNNLPVGNAAGTYIYELTVDLTGLNPQTVSISGLWAVDNIGLIDLNVGTPGGGYIPGTTNHGGASGYTPFTIPAGSPFVAGLNKIDFVVITGAAGPTGMHVDNLAGIPEPSSVALATIGGVGLLAMQYRRRRRK